MSNLRKEFSKYKQEREQHINEAAYAWAEKNIILVNEKIDRRNVKRLSDAIVKFDEKFGPYKDKIPALAAQLSTAEENLQLVLTGRVNDKKASDMLQQLSYLYRVFSDFFTTDLPILLNTGIFAAAKQNPDVRLDSIQPGEGVNHDPKVIRDTFKHSIHPSKDEEKLIRKIYSKRNMPLVDATGIANQLLSLSYNELQALTGGEKVPMVAVGEEPVQESVELNEAVLLEVDLQKLRALNADMEKLDKVFTPFASKLPSLDALVNQLRDQVMQVQNNAGSGAWDKLKSVFGGGVQKNILATHEVFRQFKQIATEITKLMKGADPNTSLQDLAADPNFGRRAQNALDLLGKAAKPGLFGTNIFGKGSLDPNTFKNEISGLTLSEIDSLARGIELAPTEEVNPNLDNPNPEQSSEQPDPYQIGDVNIQNSPSNTPAPAEEPAAPQAPLAPQNARKRAPVEPIDIDGNSQSTAPANNPTPQTPAATAPETTQPTPYSALTGDQIVSDVLTKKKISQAMQTDLKAAVDWLAKNGYDVNKRG